MVQMPFLKTNRLVSNTEMLRSLVSVLLIKDKEGKKGGERVG